ncbi:anhydro-N-acetylmuramic acid kinase [Parafilimonas sp.]|uniref:anhydro-N-acetylmuramic acid kinase n=1 Tax=Parafilimonas sp. TaxID=1969739 RepID=UPI0039E3281B
MVYRVIGLMSGSSLDGLDIVFTELEETRGTWRYNILAADCYAYDDAWQQQLTYAKNRSAQDYFLLHAAYSKYLAACVNRFIEENGLHHRVQLIASHGHTVFHDPANGVTTQLGCGATLAALTGINVVSDLRITDVALGGQGAPIVPMGEKLLFPSFDFYLNIGGIANLSFQQQHNFIAFDVCPANRVLNMLAQQEEKNYDEDGRLASTGEVNISLFEKLNALVYYKQPMPKSLSNNFGTDIVFPLIKSFELNTADALSTYTEHIASQLKQSIQAIADKNQLLSAPHKLLVTGGGAFNKFLIEKIKENVASLNIEVIVGENNIVQYKEALVMALLGILRWREENTVLASVTGASRNSIGGAVWMGQEA